MPRMDPTPPLSISPNLTALFTQVKSGANWFYLIAGVSVVNAVLALSGSTTQFILGLTITQFIDGELAGIAPNAKWLALVFDAVFAAVLVACAIQGGKAQVWAFAVGLALYLVDCGLFAFLALGVGGGASGLIIGAAFRIFALYSIFTGLQAARQLGKLRAGAPAP